MRITTLLFALLVTCLVTAQELPPNPDPGKCYVKSITEDQYTDISETVVVSPSYKKIVVVPAVYKTIEESVLVKEGGKKTVTIPATYKTIEEKILVKEGSRKIVEIPAVYKTIDEKVLVKEASKKWVTIPATYKTIEEKVLVKEETKKLVYKPATYKNIEEKIEVKETAINPVVVPQSYTTDNVQFIAKEGTNTLEVVPATFTKEEKEFLLKDKSGKWEYKKQPNCLTPEKQDFVSATYIEVPKQTENLTITSLATDSSVRELPADEKSGYAEVSSSYKKQTIKTPENIIEETIPAEYKTIVKQVVDIPAGYEEVVVPAEYATVKKVVIDTPARAEEVEIPAEYAIIKKTILEMPSRMEEVEIPAEYTTIKRQVLDTPARTETVDVPDEYTTLKRQVIDTPTRTVEEIVPEVTKTITRQDLVKKGGETVWEEVDCSYINANVMIPIHFDYNSAILSTESKSILDATLLKFLSEKPTLKVEIMSHTDSRGNDKYNKILSQKRAETVMEYLSSMGVAKTRMIANGYGETRLKNKCGNRAYCKEQQHAENRRTEFRIIQ